MREKKHEATFTFRLPAELREAMDREAALDHRQTAQWLKVVLVEHLTKKGVYPLQPTQNP
jgi:predicted HicB family RNase H-like nuclease